MNQVYNELLMKQKQTEILAQQGRRKYEYDSDEDTEVRYYFQCAQWDKIISATFFIFFKKRVGPGNTRLVNWKWKKRKTKPLN